jgi:hypothetical protein
MKKFNENSVMVAVVVSVALGLMGPIAALAAGPATVKGMSMRTQSYFHYLAGRARGLFLR